MGREKLKPTYTQEQLDAVAEFEVQGSWALVTIHQDTLDFAHTPLFGEVLTRATSEKTIVGCVINMESVNYLTATSIREMLTIQKALLKRENGLGILLTNIGPQVLDALHRLGAHEMLTIASARKK